LTFAVVWNPEDDMVAFSGAELFEASSITPTSPNDACSQVLTLPLSDNTGICTGTLQYFRENHEWLLSDEHEEAIDSGRFCLQASLAGSKDKMGRTRASSTIGELDVYSRGSWIGRARPNKSKFNSCFGGLDREFDFDPRTEFEEEWGREILVSDGGSEVEVLGLGSVTRRKDRGKEVKDEGILEAGFLPKGPTAQWAPATSNLSRSKSSRTKPSDLSAQASPELYGERRHRKLKKKRPLDVPAPPSEVLRRQIFSHQKPVMPTQSFPRYPKQPYSPVGKLYRSLSLKSLKKKFPVERWV
ncbi:hypothetical protein V5O48_016673, partial [Marasmius crinis-equi]